MSSNRDANSARWRRHIAVAAVVLALCGCSATRFAYERLDVLARWQIGRYVSLTDSQKADFDRQFTAAWQWHRQAELPRWSAELRALADLLASTTSTPEEIAAAFARFSELWRRIKRRLAPMACTLGPQLGDAQVEEILATVDEDLDELRRDSIELEPEDARREMLRDAEKPLHEWLGRLSDKQRVLIREWNEARPSVAGPWFEYRQAWRSRLGVVLAQRDQPGFCEDVSTLIVDGSRLWTDAQRRTFDENRNRWIDLFERLMPTLDAKQRAHARNRLLDLAEDFDALAAAGQSVEVPGRRQ